MSALTEFHLFPTLPSELRIKIWETVLSSPRIVHINCEKGVIKSNQQQTRFIKSFLSSTPIPPTLHVCRESRYEALSIYKTHFATFKSNYTPYHKTLKAPNYIYVAFGQDTIRCSDNLLEYFDNVELGSIEKMILEVADASCFGHFNMEVVMGMARLKELELNTAEGLLTDWRGDSKAILSRDFEIAKTNNPGWESPRVRITSRTTGEDLKVLERGALIPGWVPGDPNTFLD
ncbi:hypothetical protein ONS95_000262 [Cadophora gregata]|uniref:uncharacterized protein n=1 Tax=Cadophora gregata TaxID=51156 RepID=UPI0026DBBFEF|nr:uncharacterized protein ONS95_000262 [Cadophora gregata]KAK0128287.1 hypothetical protein ONS95_000262 [Cadophora gregata]